VPLASAAPPAPARVPRLLAPPGMAADLDAHLARWGPLRRKPASIIEEVAAAGLTGKGGAGFPTAIKLRSVLGARAPVVVANGTEGEPASKKDQALLISAPHVVLDGLSAAADAVGAEYSVICVKRTAVRALRSVRRAIIERRRLGLDRCPMELEITPDGYVTGEESALVHWLNQGDARPTFTGLRPYQRGVDRRPTLIQNVETLAHLALIARFGADWFRQVGTRGDPGTTLATVSGNVKRPGVYEVPLGTPLTEVVGSAGGDLTTASALLTGGYFGTWMKGTQAAGLPLSRGGFEWAGASLGCGVLAVVSPGSCGLAEVARVTRWMAGESAGQCGPCAHGLPAIAGAVEALHKGDPTGKAERQLYRWLPMVEGRGACRHPDGTVRFVRSALTVFAEEIDRHRRHGPCPPSVQLLPTPARTPR
jgi:NADH:ubiquinone oxidoreductase subunit F (NADH-binding)